jgi:iron complex outermembrane receptor protein
MNKTFSRSLRIAVCVALGAGTGLAAVAASAQQSTAGSSQLEDIVVTARKTSESLQEAPVAVAAFTAEQIEERQLRTVDDVARFAPGLVFDKAFGRTTDRPVIRGQGNVLAGVQAGVEAGAAYFVDGIYYPGDIQSFDFNEIERVEVIRGPQSALYGRNTYSGAINYVTRAPSDYFRVSARGSFDKDETQGSLRLEGPLSDTLAASLSLRYVNFNGQWTNEITRKEIGQEKTQQAATVLSWKPTENYDLRVRAQYTKDRDGTRPFWFQASDQNNCFPGLRSLNSYVASGSTNANQYFCGALKIRPIFLNDGPAAGGVLPLNPAVPANLTNQGAAVLYNPAQGIAYSGVLRNSRYFSALSNWDIAGSGYTLTVDGGLRVEDRRTGSDSDFMSVNALTAANRALGLEAGGANTSADHFNDYSVEVRLASPSDRAVRFIAGAFYYEQEQRLFDINFNAPRGLPDPFQISDVYNTAFFGLVEWKFAPNWSVTAEGRYATETKQFQEWATTATGIGASTFYGKQDWSKFTPRVTVKWQATPDINLYAIYADGVKPGGFNGAAGRTVTPARETYEQETSKNYELGAKTAWLDGRVVANVSLFYIDAKQIQLTQAITTSASPNAVTSLVTNQGSGDIKGAEVELRWKAHDFLTFGLNYALADSQFKQGCDDFQYTLTSGGGRYLPVASGGSTPFDGCLGSNAATNFTGQGNPSIKGKQFPLSAKNTASFTADWQSPLAGTSLEWYTNLGVSYVDKRYVQVHNLAFVPSATVIDLRFGVQKESWNAGVYIRNMSNEDAPPIATRWFTNPYIANGSAIPIPGLANLKLTNGVLTPSNTFGSYSLPRAFFGGFRRERQIGLEMAFRFGEKSAPIAATPVAAPLAPAPAPVAPPPPPDTDGDGVIDANDKCPGTPAGAKVDANGCELDADKDGVVDRLDKCPGTPAGIKVDANGCEIEEIVLRGVLFDTDKATLKGSSTAILDSVVDILKQRPGAKVELRGHTDSVGKDAYNMKLSQRRAQAVVDYLVSKGIPAENLTAKGFGETNPIASNDTAEGREQNRRVTLQFTDYARK